MQISLEQHINGQEYTWAQGFDYDNDQFGGSNITAYIQVDGTAGTCSFNHHVISSLGSALTLNPPYTGRIGFTTWDPKKGNAKIIVHSVSVTE